MSTFIPGTAIQKPVCRLVGENGNAFNILGLVCRSLQAAKVPPDVMQNFMNSAMSGDYNHLLRTCSDYVEIE